MGEVESERTRKHLEFRKVTDFATNSQHSQNQAMRETRERKRLLLGMTRTNSEIKKIEKLL